MKIVSNFTYNNFEISLVVFTPIITTNHAITYTNKTHFHKKGFALSLVLKVRVCRTRKSPIAGLSDCTSHFNVILILESASESGNSFPYFFDLIRSRVFPGSKPLNKRVGVFSYLITVKIYSNILEMPLKKRSF